MGELAPSARFTWSITLRGPVPGIKQPRIPPAKSIFGTLYIPTVAFSARDEISVGIWLTPAPLPASCRRCTQGFIVLLISGPPSQC